MYYEAVRLYGYGSVVRTIAYGGGVRVYWYPRTEGQKDNKGFLQKKWILLLNICPRMQRAEITMARDDEFMSSSTATGASRMPFGLW